MILGRALLPFSILLALSACGGNGDVGIVKSNVDDDNDGYTADVDCDDAHATINPDAEEVCDGVDNNCDGDIDGGATDALTWYDDLDADGYGDPASASLSCEVGAGQVDDSTDCDDTEATVFPGNPEVCDGLDNDCDGSVDEGADDLSTWYADADEDGYGDPALSIEACGPTTGYVADDTDCDDDDAAIHPDAEESDCADPTDYNCDGSVGYNDADGDGSPACEDCDDTDANRSPEHTEICDDANLDEDCTIDADDEDAGTDPSTMSTWYRDADSDGYSAGTGTSITQCDQPIGYSDLTGDCDDYDSGRNPGETEVCDDLDTDEDCDGSSDDDDISVDSSTWITWYRDSDADDYGDATRTVSQCNAPSNYVEDGTDCDDTDSGVNPGETEVCDAADTDEDCDGLADDDDSSVSGATTWYADTDNDGYGDSSTAVVSCEQPTGYVSTSGDCDDTSSAINPGATEICDSANADEDCDGAADDADSSATGKSTFYLDADTDGYGLTSSTTSACDRPTGYATASADCDDGDSAINPGATEICDSLNADEDCDGKADDADSSATGKSTWYRDADSDSYGTSATTTSACDKPSGYVSVSGDCDDSNSAANPGETEVCDALDTDEDCDGLADDDDSSVTGGSTWYRDADGDSYGLSSTTTTACSKPTGYASVSGDCDDANSSANPGQTEICDAANTDEDCDGLADDLDSSATGKSTWYYDGDSDSYGLSATSQSACDKPSSYVSASGDCDDGDSAINPGATEICDPLEVDEDCDGLSDDDDPSVSGGSTWYRDADTDGYGTTSTTKSACSKPSGYVSVSTDCDDTNSSINPAGTEICDAADADEDCDGLSDDADPSVTGGTTFYYDADGDGYGASGTTTTLCDPTSSYVSTSTDCDDTDSAVNPGAAEDCTTSDDDDCSGDTNGQNGSGCTDFYTDADADGYGTGSAQCWCEASGSYTATLATDCDDTDDSANPAATEVCGNGTDEDCNGTDPECASGYMPSGSYTLDSITTRVEGEASSTYAGGRSSIVGDFNNDGYDDLLIPATGNSYGEAFLFNGPMEGAYTTNSTDADAWFTGNASGDYANALANIGDQNADGYEDFAVGAYQNDTGASNAGAVYIVNGPLTGSLSLSSSLPVFYGTTASDYLGYSVSGAGDTNDDGYADLLVGAQGYNSGYGAVYLIEGDFAAGARSAATYAVTTWVGESTSYAGRTVLGNVDLNGDGEEDVVIGAYYYNSAQGRVYVYYGPLPTGTVTLGTSTADAVLTGTATGDNFGLSLAVVPDMDGDGIDELAVGAYGNDDAATNAGKIYVFYGPLTAGISTSAADITVSGLSASDYAGYSIAGIEDIDGDGGGELLVGAYAYDPASTSNGGGAFLFYSGASGDLDFLDADASFVGTADSDLAGYTVGAAGDFDADGTPDFYVAAYSDEYESSSYTNTGLVYLVPGDLDNLLVNAGETYISGGPTYDGYRVAKAGDFDHDGYDDVVSSAATNGYGYVMLHLGPLTPTTTSYDALITGDASGDYFGYGLDGGGLVNTDVYEDVLVGAPYADSGATNAGEVYLIAGRSTPISYTAGTSAYANYYGATASDLLGYSVSLVEDWDGDGYADMLMGAPGYSSSIGRVYLVTAPSSSHKGTITTYADSTFTTTSTGVQFGTSVDGDGDVDGDGYGDVVIGAPGWDSPASNAGAAFLFYGGTNGTFAHTAADATFTGEATGDAAGSAVAIVGDIDGDGYDDVAIGAPTADPHGSSSGTAYLLLGPLSGSASLSTADAQLDGVESGEQVGESVDGAGDVNADGYGDWLAGSNSSDRGYANGGEVYLIHGPETGVSAPFLYLGPYDSAYAGQGAGAGDLDADGYDDFIIGAYGKSKSWLFFGE